MLELLSDVGKVQSLTETRELVESLSGFNSRDCITSAPHLAEAVPSPCAPPEALQFALATQPHAHGVGDEIRDSDASFVPERVARQASRLDSLDDEWTRHIQELGGFGDRRVRAWDRRRQECSIWWGM